MKTPLQIRAEKLAQDFKKKGRKPVVIEFAGTPKAGKTTTLFEFNTSRGTDKRDTAEKVATTVLDLINELLSEDILCIEREVITSQLNGRSVVGQDVGRRVAELFVHSGRFIEREKVEQDRNLLQALPIVVVRKRNGQVLRLKRRERDDKNPLHDRIVLWAGGHVRREDATNGNPLLSCAVRELDEELRLNLEPSSLQLIGAIYADYGNSSSKHVAIVYEWRANSDNVEVVLSNLEFNERRGNSLSGSFVDLSELAQTSKGAALEPWSAAILNDLLRGDSHSPLIALL